MERKGERTTKPEYYGYNLCSSTQRSNVEPTSVESLVNQTPRWPQPPSLVQPGAWLPRSESELFRLGGNPGPVYSAL